MDPSLLVPTFRYPRTFARPIEAPWGVGTTGTEYVVDPHDGKVRVKVQDSSQLTTGLQSVREATKALVHQTVWNDFRRRGRRRPNQRGGITPADIVRQNRMRARMPGLNRVQLNRPSGRFGAPSRAQVCEMRRIIGNRHADTLRRRQTAASRALANRPTQRLGRAVNRGLWNVRNRLTPQTLGGKLKLGAGLGAAGVGLAALLGGILGGVLSGKKKQKKQQDGGSYAA